MRVAHHANIVMRCEASETVKAAVRMGMGVGILYRDAIASRIANGNLRLIDVPELREMGSKSFIVYDSRKPLAPMAAEFLEIVRRKQDSLPRSKRLSAPARRALQL